MLLEVPSTSSPHSQVLSRVERTLEIMHRWGYAPTVETLSKELIGGSADPMELKATLSSSERLRVKDGFVCLPGHEQLISKSRERVASNRRMNGRAQAIANEFTEDLLRTCPLVECVALSGSVASGGYLSTDDIDLDIFVREGTKYLTYAIALALGLRTSLRHAATGRIRKVICINVVWTRAQTRPFVRNDESLAFELLHCRPIFGSAYFEDVILANPWIRAFFPQTGGRGVEDRATPSRNLIGRLVGWIADRRGLLEVADRVARIASFVVYTAAHWLRRRDAEAMARLHFLRRVKYPYEVFQD